MKVSFHMTKREWINRKYHPDQIAHRGRLERLVMRGYDDTSRALPIRTKIDAL